MTDEKEWAKSRAIELAQELQNLSENYEELRDIGGHANAILEELEEEKE